MKRFRKEKFSARRGNSPRRNYKQPRRIKWTIEKRGEENYVASSGTGISVYAESPEKLREWIDS